MADLDIKDAEKVNTLSNNDSISVVVNNLLKLIPAASLYELLVKKLPTVTFETNGILNKKDFIPNLGVINTDLDNIQYSAIGYSYGNIDKTELHGVFLSLAVSGYVWQIKSDFQNRGIKVRTYDALNKVWTSWKSLSFL